ncbi:hypothetical protein SteCoe_21855 [Stentor coeruleus]|uniref:Uncharacterized protein n=1 Tax=Stentor coeruleus TaxID=5963 RepID=A0A1R2BNL8_9CILI|nr:hypothetical protein SteCoe_21855 [Stentor coeruleus]
MVILCEDINKYKKVSKKTLELYLANLDNFIGYLGDISEKIYNATYWSRSLPRHDVLINTDKKFIILNSQTFIESGVEVKEIYLHSVPVMNYSSSSSNSEYEEESLSSDMESQEIESPFDPLVEESRYKEIIKKINIL